jgi:hypothetical protein
VAGGPFLKVCNREDWWHASTERAGMRLIDNVFMPATPSEACHQTMIEVGRVNMVGGTDLNNVN